MIVVETTVLVSRPLTRVSLQLAKECRGSFVFDLHQDLINRGVQRGEACESSGGRLRVSIFLSISYPGYLSPSILSCFLLSFSLLRLLFMTTARLASKHIAAPRQRRQNCLLTPKCRRP